MEIRVLDARHISRLWYIFGNCKTFIYGGQIYGVIELQASNHYETDVFILFAIHFSVAATHIVFRQI